MNEAASRPIRIGVPLSMELLIGKMIDATTAQQKGSVNDVVTPGELESAIDEVVQVLVKGRPRASVVEQQLYSK